MGVTRRQFTQVSALALGSSLAANPLAAGAPAQAAPGKAGFWPGEWKQVPWTRVEFDWQKVIFRPRSSPGLANWCFLDQNPETKEIVLSFTEITDPKGVKWEDEQRYDFSGLKRTQVFLVSRDRGETWRILAEHPAENSPDAWQLNGFMEKLKFLPGGKMVAFGSEHTQGGRRPMLYYCHSSDMAKTWTKWQPVTDDPKRSMYAGDLCQLKDGRWLHVYEMYDLSAPTFKCRIRRRPLVEMHRPSNLGRIGCAISEDGGLTWKDRPDLDIMVDSELNGGEPFEPAIAQMSDGNIIVVARMHRRASFGGEHMGWRQWILEPTPTGFKVLSNQWSQADVPLGASGHPKLVRTRDGILLGVRSDGLWASVDDARYWERNSRQDLGYYPQAVELDDGSILVVGHRGGDQPFPPGPGEDEDVRLTRFHLDRTPVCRNLDRSVPLGFKLDDQNHRDARVRARLGTDGTVGLLARAHVENGRLSGYLLLATAKDSSWLLGRLEDGKLREISGGKLGSFGFGSNLRFELAVVGDVVRAFVESYPVASGRDRTFAEGHAGLIAEGGRARAYGYEVSAVTSLEEIGGKEIELVKDYGAVSYEQAADNWPVF